MSKSQSGISNFKGADDALNENVMPNFIEGAELNTFIAQVEESVKDPIVNVKETIAEAEVEREPMEWPLVPTPLEPRDPLPDIDLNSLPEVLRSYIDDRARNLQVPNGYIGISQICAFGSIIGSSIRIQPKVNDEWKVCPNLWYVIVGSPSIRKSPAMRAGMLPLSHISKIEADKFTEEMKSWEPKMRKLLSMQQGVEDAIRNKTKG